VTAAEIAARVAAGELSAEEVVADALERIAARPELNAVITTCEEQSLARARAGVRGRLAGVPVLIKDLIDTAGVRTTYASSIYADHVPQRSAPAVIALEAEGAIVVGKANADEFAWGVCGQNTFYGDTVNPIAPDRVAGGSSSGNAAALAAGMVPLALGTDTGGSIRLPAAACGIVGLKPAYGAVPTQGVFPLAASFDTVGPMARTVADCALAHAVLTATEVPEPALRGLRVGVLTAYPDLGPADTEAARDERALAFADRLRALGAQVDELTLPVPESDTWAVFYAETAAAHRATFPSRREEYGPLIRAKLDHAITVTAAQELEGRRALDAWRALAAREPEVDLVLAPTLGYDELPPAGVDELGVRLPFSAYTRAFSYLGWPAIAIGALQLAGRDAAAVIGAALALERDGGVR
jgi:Asp-tRNA(Asn)/Glu-tRNA(Gln) amidotransferase A subunit family amidase